MKILIVTPDLDPGGAQLAMSRLADRLAGGHDVLVYSLSKPLRDNHMLRSLRRSRIRVFSGPLRGLMERIARRLSLLEGIHGRRLRKLRRDHGIMVVNSHQAAAERSACRAFEHDPVPLIGTDHGCYRALLHPVSGLGRKEDFAAVFRRSDGLICPSQSNLDVALRHSWKPGFRTWKVFYGYQSTSPATTGRRERKDGPFVFGMIARGIPEKGWAEAVEAFQRVRASVSRTVVLRLVGAGPGLDQLRLGGPAERLEGVEFTGHVDDVPSMLSGFDVGLLPTYFELESLPNSIIEYLAHGLPVVATPMGGVREMLQQDGGTAGFIVPFDPATGRADVGLLAGSMERLVKDEGLRLQLSEATLEASRKFDLNHAVERYSEVFREVTQDASRNIALVS